MVNVVKHGPSSIFWLACALLLAATALAFVWSIALLHPSAHWIVPRGREAAVMAWVAPLRSSGFSEMPAGDVQIDRDEVRVMLGRSESSAPPPAPSWLRGQGAVSLRRLERRGEEVVQRAGWELGRVSDGSFELSWIVPSAAGGDARLGQARTLLETFSRTEVGAVFEDQTGPGAELGMLTPFARLVHLPARHSGPLALVLSLLSALAAAIAVGWDQARGRWEAAVGRTGPRRAMARQRAIDRKGGRRQIRPALWHASLGATALLAVATTTSAARLAGPDIDECWAHNIGSGALNHDHDAWVHPPLHRALQQQWVRTEPVARSAGAQAAPADRTLSVLFVTAALLILIGRAALLTPNLLVLIPLVVVAGSDVLAAQLVLARPYGLAAMLLAIAMLGLGDEQGNRTPWQVAGAWLAAGWAAILLGWTDLVTAGLIAPLMLAKLLAGRSPRPRGRIAFAAALALSACVIVPGAWKAATEFSQAPWPPLRAAAGMQSHEALRALGVALQMTFPVVTTPLVGAAYLLALAVCSQLAGKRWVAWGLGGMLVVTIALGSVMSMRERHFAPLALGCLAVVVSLNPALPRFRGRRSRTPGPP